MTRVPGRALLAAATACVLAAALFGAAVLRALDATAPAVIPPPVADSAAVHDSVDAPPALSSQALQLAVDQDPFSEARQRTAEPYRLPGDIVPEPEPPPMPVLPEFRVLGTAVSGDGGFAIMRIAEGPPRVLAVGEHLGGYQLRAVGPEYATMANDEREITVVVSEPAPTPQVATRQQPQQRGRRGQAQQGGGSGERERMIAEAVLQRLRAQGATPQMLQQVQRFIEENGAGVLSNMEIQVQDGNMTVRTRRAAPDSGPSRPPQR